MRKQRVTQQGIVFGIFVMLFVGFALFLPGFSTPDNMIALLQNVAVLGILSLGMAIVIIGRGIDLSMIATLAVPAGLILQRWSKTVIPYSRHLPPPLSWPSPSVLSMAGS